MKSGVVMLQNQFPLTIRLSMFNGLLQTIQLGNIKVLVNCLILRYHFVVDEALSVPTHKNHRLVRMKILFGLQSWLLVPFHLLVLLLKICLKAPLLIALKNAIHANVFQCRGSKSVAIVKRLYFWFLLIHVAPTFLFFEFCPLK